MRAPPGQQMKTGESAMQATPEETEPETRNLNSYPFILGDDVDYRELHGAS